MRHLVLLALALVGLPAAALTNVDLYQTEIVLDQSADNADAQARVDGMKEIIVRASGDQDAVSNPVVKKALKQNSQYLTQISYGQQNGQQTLRLGFSATHIRSLLSQAQLPIWPAARANLLVWLVEETQHDRNISWEHSDSQVLNQMRIEAQRRGLPLTVPVGDFDDITGVAVSDLWGGFARPVGEASQRYPVDAVLVVRVQGNSLRWTLYDQKPATIGVTRQAPVSGSNGGAEAAMKMVNQISDYYAKKSAVVVASESSETIKVRFTSLDNAVDFFTVENQLKKLSSVASLDILKIQGNQVTFNIHLLASQAEFEHEVTRMGKVVQLESATESQPVVKQQEQSEQPVDAVNDDLSTESSDLTVDVPEIIPAEQVLVFEWQGAPTRATIDHTESPEGKTDTALDEVIE
ncbi:MULTISPECIES: DUF2066 domain-containing protein [Vibrio]|uniref:DUF2066 domain-containing protein n=1 Tax=Vibrio TaxID=662 RepID=UPI0020765A6F|nr:MULTISPECIES: DUF2066 domain-containing protein [Vibrio]USD31768.1 DUF2066 domain-containing protein [Vibrio sp. SCSIO 43186]USD44814.1 DUF2066 domain-containing protein [Vibrio sp. SCSIO 43145]USD68891.1 DUF2066 domain-containing protein [Vibrio sp. SCSIO 43139]USD96581.1 hypothetical protein CTT30_11005 [Vibrio coralliilyticus]